MAKAPPDSAPKRPAWWGAYFAALSETGNRTAAAQAAEIDRTTPQKHVKAHPESAAEFALLEAEAIEQAADLLEKEARRRAVEGVSKPVYQGGKRVGFVREYSDVLLIFLLKAARPERYRERNVVYNVNLSELTEDQLARLAGGEPLEAVMLAGTPAPAAPVN